MLLGDVTVRGGAGEQSEEFGEEENDRECQVTRERDGEVTKDSRSRRSLRQGKRAWGRRQGPGPGHPASARPAFSGEKSNLNPKLFHRLQKHPRITHVPVTRCVLWAQQRVSHRETIRHTRPLPAWHPRSRERNSWNRIGLWADGGTCGSGGAKGSMTGRPPASRNTGPEGCRARPRGADVQSRAVKEEDQLAWRSQWGCRGPGLPRRSELDTKSSVHGPC